MLDYVLDALQELQPDRSVVVLHHGLDEVKKSLGERFETLGCEVVDQGEPKGTGHAMQVALQAMDPEGIFEGTVLVLYGDSPLISVETLQALVRGVQCDIPEVGCPAATLLTSEELVPGSLGRILRAEDGIFLAIREAKDCSPEELEIQEVNTGFCAFRASALRSSLPKLKNQNNQGEFYLTDVFEMLVEEGEAVLPILTDDPDEVLGINDLGQLAQARWILQERILEKHMENGVFIEDPATAVIEKGVQIGRGTRVLPFVVMRNGVVVGEECEVGPFSHLRVGAVLEDHAEVGNFVEMKKSILGQGSKAKHLTYLGDAKIGKKANIGAGTITANYDGINKHQTEIGDRAFIGSGTILVAPAKVGEAALTGAGALIKRNCRIGDGEIYVGVPARFLKRRDEEGGQEG
jgi:bifunctional UDP-N-acetylglucosamine pyrophosphorylase/glucosamine-1-phosphate N-acetyltransferase